MKIRQIKNGFVVSRMMFAHVVMTSLRNKNYTFSSAESDKYVTFYLDDGLLWTSDLSDARIFKDYEEIAKAVKIEADIFSDVVTMHPFMKQYPAMKYEVDIAKSKWISLPTIQKYKSFEEAELIPHDIINSPNYKQLTEEEETNDEA